MEIINTLYILISMLMLTIAFLVQNKPNYELEEIEIEEDRH